MTVTVNTLWSAVCTLVTSNNRIKLWTRRTVKVSNIISIHSNKNKLESCLSPHPGPPPLKAYEWIKTVIILSNSFKVIPSMYNVCMYVYKNIH